MTKFIILLLTCLPLTLIAHEGHHHGPSSVSAPKGGIIKSLETVYLELVPSKEGGKIYIYDKNLKPSDANKYPVSASTQKPRKKQVILKLTPAKDHWNFLFDAKGAHRYTLHLNIEQGGHKDKIKWTVEPNRNH